MKTGWKQLLKLTQRSYLISLILALLLYFLPFTQSRALIIDKDLNHTFESNTTPTIHAESSYRIFILLAQVEAKCLRDYGGHEKEEAVEESEDANHSSHSNKQGLFTNYQCVKNSSAFDQCDQCLKFTKEIPTSNRCQELCGIDDVCSVKCLDLVKKVNELTKPLSDVLKSTGAVAGSGDVKINSGGISLKPPEVFCEDMSLPDVKSFHSVVLKWSVDFNMQNENGSDSITTIPPIVFVVQRMDIHAMFPSWETRGKTRSVIQSVNSPYFAMTYRYRITAVTPDGAEGRAESGPIETHNGWTKTDPPPRIYIIKDVVHDEAIDILVGWDPPEDKPCDYKVFQHPQDGDGKSVLHRFSATDLQNGRQVWFYDLKFKKTYEIGITSRRGSWEGYESALKSQSFTMPTCLMAHSNRFDKCVPSQPRSITYGDLVIIEEKDGEGLGQIKVKWEPPLHTSEQNKLKGYTLILGMPMSDKGSSGNYCNNSMAAHSLGIALFTSSKATYHIAGDVTEFVIKNVELNRCYSIALIASSIKGDSPPITHVISTYTVKEEEESLVTSWIYLSIPISLMILGIFACHFLRVLVQKRQVKQARNQYFQSMDERDAMSPDWSIVPLNDDSPTLKFLSEGPKEKWEISYDNLIMGEVIGQGAFGVVRRAKMTRRKNQICGGPKYSMLSETTELDENGYETVAVKMLKVSATRDDRDQLIKEIVTMQHLGGHPQIVSLLGACTKGRSLCLVLEFCPGGDLLSFLRKVRAKYWPTLGLSNNRQSWSDKSLERQNLMRNTTSIESGCNSGDSYNSNNSHKSGDSSPINYADTVPSSESSSSPGKLTSPADTVINHQYGKMPVAEPEDDCRPIDEKDILSYARQIAMGMEFLEKNRVVHRDLAGRNVLLLGDYKQVKISDFGLSRDIYTWNVYHQKSNGKLPIKWMAIESIFTHVFTSKSDVWSFGILLWELVTLGGTPYPGLGNTELFHLLKSGYRMERPDNCSEEIYALMKKCWRTSPVSRPNFTELRRFLETMLEAAEPSLYLSLMADIPVDYFHLSSKNDLLHLKLEDDSPLRDSSGGPYNYAPTTKRQYNQGTNNINSPYSSNAPKKTRTKYPHTQIRSSTNTPSVPDLSKAGRLLVTNPPETSSSISQLSMTKEKFNVDGNISHPLIIQGHTRRSPAPIRSHSSFKRSRSRSLRSDGSATRIPINDSLQEIKRSSKFGGSSESLVSPDSGIPRSESEAGGGHDLDEAWSDPDDIPCTSPLQRPTNLQMDQSSSSTPRSQRSIPLKNLNSMTLLENRTFLG